MTFVTSRNFELPDTPEGLTNPLWFNMWSRKLWPYNELEPGDTLFWYESPTRCIVWRSKVVDVNRFPYERKKEVETKLNLTTAQAAQPYFLDAPDSGFCLSYRVEALERVSLPKPDDFRFPQQGWLRVDDELPEEWRRLLGGATAATTPTASDIGNVKPERAATTTYRILRDTALARRVKVMHNYECQICGHPIVLPNGSRYAEAHHIKPLGTPHDGLDTIGNILCLCPNHHAECDLGAIRLSNSSLRVVEGHSVDKSFVLYHNQEIYGAIE